MEEKFKLPTEVVELPSKGLIYPKENPLSSGEVEIKYPTAKEEDILTNQNYIRKKIVIDQFLKSLLVSKINYDDLVLGDKNALLISARILAYGKDYTFGYDGEPVTVDLTQLKEKYLDPSLFTEGINEFEYILPKAKNQITFKLLTHKDEKLIEEELEGLRKSFPAGSFEITTRLKYIITSVDGHRDTKTIREFVDKYLLASDSRDLRSYINKISPDILLEFDYDKDGYTEEGITIPVGLDFFWPKL